MHLKRNTLFYGDNLDILREYSVHTFKQARKVKENEVAQPGLL